MNSKNHDKMKIEESDMPISKPTDIKNSWQNNALNKRKRKKKTCGLFYFRKEIAEIFIKTN